MLLLLGGCKDDDEDVLQKEETILEDVEWSYIEEGEESLDGWSEGVCSENCYVLIKTDTLDKTKLVYINSFRRGNDGIIMKIDEEARFYTIISNNKTYGFYKDGNKVYVSEIDKDGTFINNSSFILS